MSEFETPDFFAEVGPDGSVRIPASYLEERGLVSGMRVAVRVTPRTIAETLRARGITEAMVEAIGSAQREGRENVLAFLMAEGSLADEADAMDRFGAWLRSAE